MNNGFKGLICRGSIILGTACGGCEKCKDEIAQIRASTKENTKDIRHGTVMFVQNSDVCRNDIGQIRQMEMADIVVNPDVIKNRYGYRGKIISELKGIYTRDQLVEIVDDVVTNTLESFFDASEPKEYLTSVHARLSTKWDVEFEEEEPEEIITVTYSIIKATCGWVKFARQCDHNEWAVNEFGINDNETFQITMSDAIELGIIPRSL